MSVGVDHDTAEFAVATLQRWGQQMGQPMYPQAHQLLLPADGGGSNGSRLRLWKVAVQKFSDATGLEISVCHLPPATSKWNKIEHRLFSQITEHWRGRPLLSLELIVHLMANTTPDAGLHVEAAPDLNPYTTGKQVSDEEWAQVNLYPAAFHSNDWNYVIKPTYKYR